MEAILIIVGTILINVGEILTGAIWLAFINNSMLNQLWHMNKTCTFKMIQMKVYVLVEFKFHKEWSLKCILVWRKFSFPSVSTDEWMNEHYETERIESSEILFFLNYLIQFISVCVRLFICQLKTPMTGSIITWKSQYLH